MHAVVGDRIEVRTGTLDRPPRLGTVREVLSGAEAEHFLVGWDDGHESLLYPGSDTHIIPAQTSRERPLPEPEAAPAAPGPSDPVEQIMSSPVATVDEHDSLRTTAVTLADAEVGALVVMSGRTPLGVISERDVVRALAAGGDPDEVWAADVIGISVVWGSPTDTIRRVAELMRDADVRHIPLRVQDSVVGMVSIRDIHKVLLG
ncbi:CBS domain-containing protein [Actinopolymorpha sp. B11F2]|uniref:CBS domain-containing protein n=1 Tax=Actinopolymorpha sp. B11F2 TaxID=3160862 RepID=UPI0032E43118